MVLQEGCLGAGGVPNGETCLKKPCPWLRPALSYLHHLIIWPSTYREEYRKKQDSCGGPEAAVHVWQGGVAFPGLCSLHTSGMQQCWVSARAPGPQHTGMATWCKTTAKQPLTPSYVVIFSPPSCLFLFSAQTLHSSQLPHARAAMRAL